MAHYLIERIAKGRIACLKDNEDPRDVLISIALKHQIRRECEPFMAFLRTAEYEKILGMNIEWVRAEPNDISIRTVKGDVRRI